MPKSVQPLFESDSRATCTAATVSSRRAALDDDEHRRAELVREVGVEAEREPAGDPAEVGALDEDEVAALGERPVRVQDALAQLLVVVDRVGLGLRERVQVVVVVLELVAAPDELELRVGLVRRHDRPEEAEPVDPGREQLHEPERDERLAAPRLHPGDVEAARQRSSQLAVQVQLLICGRSSPCVEMYCRCSISRCSSSCFA